MRKFAMIGIVTAIAAIVSGSLVTASYKAHEGRTSSVDPTEITLKARDIPVAQFVEAF